MQTLYFRNSLTKSVGELQTERGKRERDHQVLRLIRKCRALSIATERYERFMRIAIKTNKKHLRRVSLSRRFVRSFFDLEDMCSQRGCKIL